LGDIRWRRGGDADTNGCGRGPPREKRGARRSSSEQDSRDSNLLNHDISDEGAAGLHLSEKVKSPALKYPVLWVAKALILVEENIEVNDWRTVLVGAARDGGRRKGPLTFLQSRSDEPITVFLSRASTPPLRNMVSFQTSSTATFVEVRVLPSQNT
jgi:hypothetical protein